MQALSIYYYFSFPFDAEPTATWQFTKEAFLWFLALQKDLILLYHNSAEETGQASRRRLYPRFLRAKCSPTARQPRKLARLLLPKRPKWLSLHGMGDVV